MENLVMAIAGMEMVEKLKEIQFLERMEKAETEEEKIALVRETEKFGFEVVDEIFKSDEEIGEDGVEIKNDLIRSLVNHNYEYFDLPVPSFDEVRERVAA